MWKLNWGNIKKIFRKWKLSTNGEIYKKSMEILVFGHGNIHSAWKKWKMPIRTMVFPFVEMGNKMPRVSHFFLAYRTFAHIKCRHFILFHCFISTVPQSFLFTTNNNLWLIRLDQEQQHSHANGKKETRKSG